MALIVFLLLASFPGGDAVSTLRKTSVLRGASVTIPCHYEDKYKSHVKYWCSGYYWTSCESLKRTDSLITQSDKVSISDDPAQGVFTVTMRGLKTGDTGWYWCAVEIGGYGTPDDRASLYLTVTEDATVLYVVHATVTGQIGGEVSVQCRYGHPYRSRQKQWCRSGDWSSCQTAGSPGTTGHGSVLITDHTAEGLFSVTVSGLRPEDQGWYWCDIGDQQLPVYLSVTNALETTTQNQLETRALPSSPVVCRSRTRSISIVSGALCVLVLALFTAVTLLRNKQQRSGTLSTKAIDQHTLQDSPDGCNADSVQPSAEDIYQCMNGVKTQISQDDAQVPSRHTLHTLHVFPR
ncbi:polymeric immunoglobulin receptor [Amia ocellicauda]|uniref:polymeric immunoglobulin receptor n=1 Tax=Amia ocellicauda TaxID=2972642 RepID=UPI003464B2AD